MIEIVLDNKEDYNLYINSIYKYAKYIEYVVLDYDNEPNRRILEFFEKNNIHSKKVSSWKGTDTKSKNNRLYKFNTNSIFKKILLEFDNFFIIEKTKISNNVYHCTLNETDWGKSDIAFYSKDGKIISFIIAHEGDVLVDEKYIDGLRHLIIDDKITYLYGLS